MSSRENLLLFVSSSHLDRPDVKPLVKGAGGQVLAIRGESQRVNRLPMTGQRVQALARINVPNLDPGVKRGTRQQQRVGRTPLYRVNLLCVFRQILHR
jgi:hypothetical protein